MGEASWTALLTRGRIVARTEPEAEAPRVASRHRGDRYRQPRASPVTGTGGGGDFRPIGLEGNALGRFLRFRAQSGVPGHVRQSFTMHPGADVAREGRADPSGAAAKASWGRKEDSSGATSESIPPFTSASPAILAGPRPEALRAGIAPGVLFSVIVGAVRSTPLSFKKRRHVRGVQLFATRLFGSQEVNFSTGAKKGASPRIDRIARR